MKLFGQLVRTVVNVALLPVDIVKDVVMLPLDATLSTDKHVGERTTERLQRLKDESEEQ